MMECCWTLILSILAGVLGVYYLIYRNVNYFKRKGIPYAKATPLLGNLGPNILGKISSFENIQRLYNIRPDVKYLGVYDFTDPVIMLRDPELIKSITIENFDNFRDHGQFVNQELDPILANGLLALKGDRWRDMRSHLSPTFTSGKMKTMFELVSQCGVHLAEYLRTKAAQPIEIEMKDIFARFTNDVITTTAFGISVNSFEDEENEFYLMGRQGTNFSGIRFLKLLVFRFSPFLFRLFNMRILSDKVDKFFNHVIGSTIAMRDEKGIVRNDMLQLMMRARDTSEKLNLTTKDMVANAFVFYFGGFETTSWLMAFAAHEIGINSAIQAKLQAEIDAVLAESQGEVSYAALNGMRYLDAVLSEALRFYPPFPVLDRVCTKEFELPPAAPGFSPFLLEVGRTILLPCSGIHRDPKYFPDPDKFDPERFSEENKGNIPPYAYLPFGLGPRSCIGNRFALMGAKLALFHLFAKCTLSPCSKTSIPMKFDKKIIDAAAENGVWLTIQRRY